MALGTVSSLQTRAAGNGSSLLGLDRRQMMTGKSVTRADLTEAVYQQVPVTRKHAAELVHQVLEAICSTLATGEAVKLSSFGVFTVRNKGKRMGRNPRTGDKAPIALRRSILFTASPVLKAQVNQAAKPSCGSTPVSERHLEKAF
jgi:integration host factor subunit alpha